MYISYETDSIRQLDTKLRGSFIEGILTASQVEDVRSVISDLKACNTLKDAPVSYSVQKYEDHQDVLIEEGDILIQFKVISKRHNINIDKIDRLKLVNIIRTDIQSNPSNATNFTEHL